MADYTPPDPKKQQPQPPQSPTADRPPPFGPMMQDRQRFWAQQLRRREQEAGNP